jgi:two-component system nitrate/nitrite response regulator NarL
MATRTMTGDRVLIVDDHAGFRATARRLLESEGWTVVGEAGDGAAALAAAATLHPDVVLLDVGLPDADGIDLAGRFAAVSGAEVDVVLVSSRERPSYGPRLDASAAIGFIAKHDLAGGRLRAILATRR